MKNQVISNTSRKRFEKAMPAAAQRQSVNPNSTRLQRLTEAQTAEVLEFLAVRPVHTVVMTSFINDNGLKSAENRGEFFAYRNVAGTLEGVALIGHATLIEARSGKARAAFARAARQSKTPIHILMSDGDAVEFFWKDYAKCGQKPRLVCTELLFELSFPFFKQECEWTIRLACAGELEAVAEAHAEIAFAESGIDPLIKDRAGFFKRCLNRIEKKRTFVVCAGEKLVFKADIAAETSDVVYLEGIYVAPEFRGQDIAAKCLATLGSELLNRAEHVCLFSNDDFASAHRSYAKAGFKIIDRSTTIFV